MKKNYKMTRSSGGSAPFLLAPVQGWGALQAPRALWALLGAFDPSSVAEGAKEDTQFSVKIAYWSKQVKK